MRKIIEKLESELRPLEHELRIELPREIKTAVAMGDLKENAEYHAALERQSFVRARIGQLRERLSAVSSLTVSAIPEGKVGLGSTLTVEDLDTQEESTYQLVFPELADLDKGLLSVASPIGKALLGKEEGDEVEIQIPSGLKRMEILELKTAHGADDDDV
ncbi:MAG: transcription elongation factor GreA [Acidobacteriota bacterium]|nr:transcription elongation factor GreA [Acidobacteriota bacterium]MDH3785450.1 transcription elongation factor GreA [Acidobacteriota bacterium]